MKVRVYRNLHRNCLSVQHWIPGKGWRLHSHVAAIDLTNVTFKVSEAGRQRVLRTRKKNVHAFVCGLDLGVRINDGSHYDVIRYNPYAAGHFATVDTGRPVTRADWAVVSTKRGILAGGAQ